MGKCQILFCLRSASQLSAVEGKSIYRGIEKASISYKYKNTSKYILLLVVFVQIEFRVRDRLALKKKRGKIGFCL